MRRPQAFLPVVLLAVLVQLLAPIAAFRAAADVTNDPLRMASICTDMASMAPAAEAQDAPAFLHSHPCCAFCGAGNPTAIAIGPPQLVFATLQRQYQRISWLEAADRMPVIRAASNARARAPPRLT